MKLSRYDLVHAKDTQLKAISLNRKLNSGWLQRALKQEFTEAQIELFHKAKEKILKSEKIDPLTDKHVDAVRDKLRDRMRAGLRKYGVTTERTDLTRKDWLRHAQEEAMDLAVYLERLIQDEDLSGMKEHVLKSQAFALTALRKEDAPPERP